MTSAYACLRTSTATLNFLDYCKNALHSSSPVNVSLCSQLASLCFSCGQSRVSTTAAHSSQDALARFVWNTAMKKCKHSMRVFNKVASCLCMTSISESHVSGLQCKLVQESVLHYRLIQPEWRSLYSLWTPSPTNLLGETLLQFVHWIMWVLIFKLGHWSTIMQSSLAKCFLEVPALINTSWMCFPEFKVIQSTQVSFWVIESVSEILTLECHCNKWSKIRRMWKYLQCVLTQAVCCQQELSDDVYQRIAAEMNLSDTAFITKISSSDSFTTGLTHMLLLAGHSSLHDWPLNILYCQMDTVERVGFQ